MIANYETLFVPFDRWTWYGLLICTGIELVALFFVDWLYRTTEWGKANAKRSYYYDGERATMNRRIVTTIEFM